jgi:hypothetical protein
MLICQLKQSPLQPLQARFQAIDALPQPEA